MLNSIDSLQINQQTATSLTYELSAQAESIVPYPPENKPPFFSIRHGLDWGGGLFLNMHIAPQI